MSGEGLSRRHQLEQGGNIQPLVAGNQAVMSGRDTDQDHVQAERLLQLGALRLQRLGQPLAHGAKSKQSETKRFHVVPVQT